MLARIPFNVSAKQRLVYRVTEFRRSLGVIATELARRDGTDEVQTVHIEEAKRILSPDRRYSRFREFGKIFGGALVGAFFPGFITTLNASDPVGLVIYTAFGMVGLTIIFYSLR